MLCGRCALMLCLSPEICKFYVRCNILSPFRLREIRYDGDHGCVSEECTPHYPPSPPTVSSAKRCKVLDGNSIVHKNYSTSYPIQVRPWGK
jgi:hypothetical protein